MLDTAKHLKGAFESIRAALRQDLSAKGINASGSLSKSLRIETDDKKGELYGNDYFKYSAFGRGPTKGGGDGSLYERIQEWVENKPVFAGMSEKDKKRFAYFATRKIHREGTQRGRSSQYPGISAQQIFDRESEKIKPKILGELRANFVDAVRGAKSQS